MSKFKVGDKVRIIEGDSYPDSNASDNFSGHGVGYEFIIEEIFIGNWCREKRGISRGVQESRLELVEENLGMTKFKIGDKVKIVKGSFASQNYEGMTGNIIKLDSRNNDWCEIELKNGMIVPQNNKYGDITELVKEKPFLKYGFEHISFETVYTATQNDLGGLEELTLTNKIKKTMNNIIDFAKNLTLSAEEKLLREFNLKRDNGEYTNDAQQLVLNKIVKENESYLIETAKAMKAEQKENK